MLEVHEITHEAEVGRWRLTHAAASPPLAGDVHGFWEVEGALSPFREALLPNGFVEVMANLGPPHRVLEGAGVGVWEGSWYSGLQERAIFIESLAGTHLVSARLTPLGAARLLGDAAPRAANAVVDLASVVGERAATLHAALLAAPSARDRFAIVERFLLDRRPAVDPVPTFVREAAARIDAAHGALRLDELAASLAVSRKHLAVSFRRWIGLPPKSYASIRRFLWTLERLGESESVEWSKLAAEAGYSDQSHLARDFRRVGAASPREYLRRIAPTGDALVEVVTESRASGDPR